MKYVVSVVDAAVQGEIDRAVLEALIG